MDVQEAYMTIPEAAALLGVSRAALYDALRDERLTCETIFGKRVLRKEAVAVYQQRTASVGKKGGRPKKSAKVIDL